VHDMAPGNIFGIPSRSQSTKETRLADSSFSPTNLKFVFCIHGGDRCVSTIIGIEVQIFFEMWLGANNHLMKPFRNCWDNRTSCIISVYNVTITGSE
jgi:hypothetical protein